MVSLKKIFSNPIILIWITVLIILIPILRPGFFSFHDETHIVDVYQMIRALAVDGFPPRFVPDFNFGLGHPYYNFYYHLPFYLATIFYYLTSSMTVGYKLMLGLAVVLAASGFYLFLRNHVSKTSASFGTLVYLLSPYFAVDLYVRGAPGEMYILGLFPWAGYALYRYLKSPTAFNLAFCAVLIFLIAISHNVLLPFIYSFLFLYGLVSIFIFKTKVKDLWKIVLPFILGILLGAYYLLPAFAEIGFISNYEQINIADHFPFIKQLIIPHWGYGPSIWGPLDDISFDIGTVNLILLACSFIAFKFAKREFRILLIFFWLSVALAVVFMNSRTLPFWESIRFLRLFQFPWRLLLVTTISTSIIAAITIEVFIDKFKKYSKVFLVVIFISLIGLNIWHYHPSEYKQISDERYLELYFANRTLKGDGVRNNLSPDYLNFTEDFIPPTKWQSKRPSELQTEVYLASPAGAVNFSNKGLYYLIDYETPVENKIIISRAFFPGWQAYSGFQFHKIEPYSEYGVIAIPVPSGSGGLELEFRNTPVRIIANTISAFTALLILVLLTYPQFKRIKR